MSAPASALYVGSVSHRRLRPRPHALSYRVFWMLLDLDEIDGLASRLRLFSRGRLNLFSFHDADYGDRSGSDLRRQVEARLVEAGLAVPGGPIRLFTMPRVLGYAFNPLSVFFCHRPDGKGAGPIKPLDGAAVVLDAEKAKQIAVLLNGQNNGAMPSWKQLSDSELAAVITYTKNHWSNKTGQLVQPSDVVAARK